MAIEVPFILSICPRIRAEGDRLTASTSWIIRGLSLGTVYRRVVVDRMLRSVTIETVNLYVIRRTTLIAFDQITAVTYGYEDVNPFASWSATHDAIDRYLVGLRTASGGEEALFYFTGDGFFTNDSVLPDWWYWEESLGDFAGSQERESKLFVRLLSQLIGVTIEPSSLVAGE